MKSDVIDCMLYVELRMLFLWFMGLRLKIICLIYILLGLGWGWKVKKEKENRIKSEIISKENKWKNYIQFD